MRRGPGAQGQRQGQADAGGGGQVYGQPRAADVGVALRDGRLAVPVVVQAPSQVRSGQAATLPASAFGEHPGALRLRLATGLLYGDTEEQQAAALTAPNPLTPAWIASALARLDQILTDLARRAR